MKIVNIITKSEIGGAQVHVLNLVRHQKALGARSVVLVGDDGFLATEAREIGAEVIISPEIIHPIRPIKDFLAVIRLVSLLNSLSPNLVHAHSSKAGLLARLACAFVGVPCIFTSHGWAFSEGAPKIRAYIARAAEAVCAKLGHTIVNVSFYDRDLALYYKVGRPNQHRVIHNGLPDVKHRPQMNKKTIMPITMVARFAAPKRQDLLIRALPFLPTSARLCLIGDGSCRAECEALAQQLSVVDRIEFVGDSDQVVQYLAEARIFVLLSEHEGLPLTIIEAMRAGLPVVASSVGGIPELVKDGVTGVLLRDSSPEAVAAALKSLLDDPKRAWQMGQNGRERYLRHFTEQQMLNKLDALYAEILADR